ncbi:MAG: dihydroorotase [Pseudomonadales bacterium]|nr:dihydroorotase [Pseudomonadales bacterium]
MRSLTIARPDDWHIHLRDGAYLSTTVPDLARVFARAIIMPNLLPPIDQVQAAEAYRNQIIQAIPPGIRFEPLMTMYLTEQTSASTIVEAKKCGFVHAFKLYPAGATTNSNAGISAIKSLYPVFEEMQKQGMHLCIHGEVTNNEVDIFDREAAFIDESLLPITKDFPKLKIIFEHITTIESIDFVKEASNNVAATITVHHLLYNRNHMLAGGMKPLYYCLPILKRNKHQQALITAATSGSNKFFLGTDSAPHPRSAKENICGCAAGIYTAHAAIELYAEAFDLVNALDKLEGFSSFYGPDFYGLERNKDKITLTEESWQVPATLKFGEDILVPLRSEDHILWKVNNST